MSGDWFDRARFGMFVHWGMFSAQGWEPSWPLVGGLHVFEHCQSLTVEAYYERAAEFTPPPDAPRTWMRAARECGMEYAVLTTKHHDGYALFDCDAAPFGVRTFLPGRDLVREFVEAARAEGLRVGLYVSLPDWHHPDYPAFTDADAPYDIMRLPRSSPDAWDRFRTDLLVQLEHLMTAYGTIDLIWFDGGWERSPAEWGAVEIEALLRHLNPDVVINDRLPGVGDYDTPEQGVPHSAPARPWETCMTMAESWGPLDEDVEHKSARHLLGVLADVASAGGRLLLNISPLGDGTIPDWQAENLAAIAAWMHDHAPAVLGTERGLEPWQFFGPTTRRGDVVHLLCPMRPQEQVVLRGVRGLSVQSVRALGSGAALPWQPRLTALDKILRLPDPVCDVVIDTPEAALDDMITVIEVTFRP